MTGREGRSTGRGVELGDPTGPGRDCCRYRNRYVRWRSRPRPTDRRLSRSRRRCRSWYSSPAARALAELPDRLGWRPTAAPRSREAGRIAVSGSFAPSIAFSRPRRRAACSIVQAVRKRRGIWPMKPANLTPVACATCCHSARSPGLPRCRAHWEAEIVQRRYDRGEVAVGAPVEVDMGVDAEALDERLSRRSRSGLPLEFFLYIGRGPSSGTPSTPGQGSRRLYHTNRLMQFQQHAIPPPEWRKLHGVSSLIFLAASACGTAPLTTLSVAQQPLR